MDKNNNTDVLDFNPETIELLSYFKSNEDVEVKVKFLDDICSKLIDKAIEVDNEATSEEYIQIIEEIYCINFFKKLAKSFMKEKIKEDVKKK